MTDYVYDEKEIYDELMSEVYDMAGNMEADAYEAATYEAERIPPSPPSDAYRVEDTSPCKDPIDRPRIPTKRKDEQSYDNIEPKNFYNDTL